MPGGGDGPLGPAALAALATALDPRLVHRVGDQADRDEEFADAPPGTLVIAADGTAWWRAASTWVTLYEPVPAWRGITLKAGYEQNAVNLGVRRTQGTFVSLKGRVNATSGNINSPDAAINIGSVPADCIPTALRGYAATCSLGGETTLAAARLEVLGANTSSSSGEAGDILLWYQGPGGTPWMDISGFYWMD
ncbi:hypothetical protein D7M15_16200 [Streptomyces sp. Z26]|nr:hypothetical protein D7M15_16200 [Streptomyces sp. Z26]